MGVFKYNLHDEVPYWIKSPSPSQDSLYIVLENYLFSINVDVMQSLEGHARNANGAS